MAPREERAGSGKDLVDDTDKLQSPPVSTVASKAGTRMDIDSSVKEGRNGDDGKDSPSGGRGGVGAGKNSNRGK